MVEALSAILIGTGSYEGERVVWNENLPTGPEAKMYRPDGTFYPDYTPLKLQDTARILRRVKTTIPLTRMMENAGVDCVNSTTRPITDVDLVLIGTNSMCRDIRDVSGEVIDLFREYYGLTSWTPQTYTIVSGCPVGEVAEDVARQFIETGKSIDTLVISAEILEYDPHDPNGGLFSDVAGAARYIAVPDGEIVGESQVSCFSGSPVSYSPFEPLKSVRGTLASIGITPEHLFSDVGIVIAERKRGLTGTVIPPDAARIQGDLAREARLDLATRNMGCLDVIVDKPSGIAAREIAERYVASGAVSSAVAMVIHDDGLAQAWHYQQRGIIKRMRSRGIMAAYRWTNGTLAEHIIQGPSYNPAFVAPDGFNNFFHVNNHAVYQDAVEGVPLAFLSLLEHAPDPSNVTLFGHPTNMKMIEAGAKRLATKILGHHPSWEELQHFFEHRMPTNISMFGNCSGASVQFLRDQVLKGTLPRTSISSTLPAREFAERTYTIAPENYVLRPGSIMADVSVGAGMALWGKLWRLDELYEQLKNPKYWASLQR